MPKFDIKDEDLISIILEHKESAWNWRERRHNDWTENYLLYRDKVIYNRLTQRQSYNVPLMKSSLKTLLKDVNTPPQLYYKELTNDDQKEVFFNEYWKKSSFDNKLVIKDQIDKKQVLLFGRSFKKLNIVNGRFSFEVADPQDILGDRYIDPASIDTLEFLSHIHIWKPLDSLLMNDYYNKTAVRKLQQKYADQKGLITNEENQREIMAKAERMEAMGVTDVQAPILGQQYVELNDNFMYMEHPTYGRVLCYIVTADNEQVLFKLPLCDVIGHTADDYWYNHVPFTTWADDVERTDFWSDGVADTLRSSNKILNSWASQMIENRTLRNFGMNYYDSSNEKFIPQTFQPVPWGWYPTPGDPNKIVKSVEVPDLSDTLKEIQFIMEVAERASAATSVQQGVSEKSQITLGEIQILLTNAQDRVRAMASLYNDSWREFGEKYIKMLEASGHLLDTLRIEKKGRNTEKMYVRDVAMNDWKSELGYTVEVRDESDATDKEVEKIQKLDLAVSKMPNNRTLQSIHKKTVLEFAKLDATEVKDVMKEEQENLIQEALMQAQVIEAQRNGGLPAGQPQMQLPQSTQMPAQVAN
jgi:hypothetical protein